MDRCNLASVGGLFVLMFVAWLASADRRRVNPRVVAAGALFTSSNTVLGAP